MRARLSVRVSGAPRRGTGKRRTLLVGIQNIVVGVAEREAVGHRGDLDAVTVQPSPGLVVGEILEKVALGVGGTACYGVRTVRPSTGGLPGAPRTSRFFSGSRLPLATDSSIEIHRSFFFSPSLPSDPAETDVYAEKRFVFAITTAAPSFVC